jgi:cytochrome b
MNRVRIIHTFLALFATAAYLASDVKGLHQWLGYGVLAVIIARLIMVFTSGPQMGLFRFYPRFAGLKPGAALTHPAISRVLLAAIAISLIGTVATGISMDQGKALGRVLAPAAQAAERDADDDDEGAAAGRSTGAGRAAQEAVRQGNEEGEGAGGKKENEWLEELHETFGNALLISVLLHVSYLLAFKRPLALYMLYARRPKTAA